MSHNSKYYRKTLSSKVKSQRIDIFFKQKNLETECNEPKAKKSRESVDNPDHDADPSVSSPSLDSSTSCNTPGSDDEQDSDHSESEGQTDNFVSQSDARLFHVGKYESQYPWLYYSVARNGFLCKYCEFSNGPKGKLATETPFAENGVKLGTHPSRKLDKHEKSKFHELSCKLYHGGFLESNSSKSVLQLLRDQNQEIQDEKQRRSAAYMEVLFKTTFFMIKRRWAVSDNLDEMIQFLANDLNFSKVTDHLEVYPNAKYTSHMSVSEIVQSISGVLEEDILNDLRQAEWFALLADESSDVANREQFAVIVRFVWKGNVREEYLGLIHLDRGDAESLMKAIESFLIAKGVNIQRAIFVGFDGCNTMSGVNTGKYIKIITIL